ncbi:penicillin-binding transpeptidase domain-containing protein [Caballeronia sp. PC1]|uniref:penicillin-binding transpeptidase domain-containing protein n=1 Tax=Caballeronia sp. PC1 TaxID=2906765 RepID=UPI002102817B|nr:penicillin-binding transpeptidase domain-containing protein [Caballeronia sp. PC1]
MWFPPTVLRREYAVPGYSVAGKTGTAYKWTTKGYDRQQYRASFIGIVPAKRPRVVIAVSIDRPLHGSHFGGAVAGPPFVTIATQAMQVLNVAPDKSTGKKAGVRPRCSATHWSASDMTVAPGGCSTP